MERAKRKPKLPVVLSSAAEVGKVLAAMGGVHGLVARLLYGTGMRLMACSDRWPVGCQATRLNASWAI